MKRLIVDTNEWRRELSRQNFYPHELSNGTIIMVSIDGQYYYQQDYCKPV